MDEVWRVDERMVIIRRFAVDDLERLQRLYREAPELARDLTGDSLETLREQLSWPGHVPTRDRWVALRRWAPDRLIGYSSVFKAATTPRADLLVVTHPVARRQGLGSELLRRALADAAALGAIDAAIYVNDQDVEAAAFLHRRGFTPVGAYTELSAEGERQFPQAEWPAGVSIRPWRDERDLPTLVEVANRGYAELWGHNHTTTEEWAEWLPTLDTQGIFMLFGADGNVIGIVRAQQRTTDGRHVGVVDAPGVVAEQRSVGLYRPLLLHALSWLAEQRPATYMIESWSDDPAVIAEYQDLGFVTTRRETLFRLELSSPSQP